MAKSIGISFGNNYCVVAHHAVTTNIIRTGPNNEDFCRSCVAIDKNGNALVGNLVYNKWRHYVPNIVTSPLLLLGARFSDSHIQNLKFDKENYPFGITRKSNNNYDELGIVLGGKDYTPECIFSELFRTLKIESSLKLGDDVTSAVITVPIYFNEKQATAVRRTAELAGLKVLRLLAEPIAAAISYGFENLRIKTCKTLLVYDFGAKSIDLSILTEEDNQYFVSYVGGDRELGGDDIDTALTKFIFEQTNKEYNTNVLELIDAINPRRRFAFLSELKKQIEHTKKALSYSKSANIGIYDELETEDGDVIDIDVNITRDNFDALISPIVQRTINLVDELIEKSGYYIESIDNILLVGGSSCIPLVRNVLVAKFGKEKILYSENPMYANAIGAAILASQDGREIPFLSTNDDVILETSNRISSESTTKNVSEIIYNIEQTNDLF